MMLGTIIAERRVMGWRRTVLIIKDKKALRLPKKKGAL